MIKFSFLLLTANTKHRKFFAPCKGNQDSPGVWIPSRGFRISGTGFQIFVSGTWIPDSLSCIPDSSSKNFLDSGMQTPLHGVRFGSNRSFRRLCVYWPWQALHQLLWMSKNIGFQLQKKTINIRQICQLDFNLNPAVCRHLHWLLLKQNQTRGILYGKLQIFSGPNKHPSRRVKW